MDVGPLSSETTLLTWRPRSCGQRRKLRSGTDEQMQLNKSSSSYPDTPVGIWTLLRDSLRDRLPLSCSGSPTLRPRGLQPATLWAVGFPQAEGPQWAAISFPGISQPRDQTHPYTPASMEAHSETLPISQKQLVTSNSKPSLTTQVWTKVAPLNSRQNLPSKNNRCKQI